MRNINPYIPQTGSIPPYFSGRNNELKLFETRIQTAKEGGNIGHLAIIGEWGIGKTSLLKELKTIAAENKCESKLVVCPEIKDSNEFSEFIIGKVISPTERIKIKSVNIMGSGGEIDREVPHKHPQVRLVDALSEKWNNIKEETKLYALMVDDIDKLLSAENALTTLRSTFIELSMEYECRYMLIVTGAEDLFDRFAEYGMTEPLTRFFEPIILRRLNKEETRAAILKPLEKTSIEFENEVVDKIVNISEGHPYYIQLLCHRIYERTVDKAIDKADMGVYEDSFEDAINDISVTRFNKIYPKSEIEKTILEILSVSDEPLSHAEIATEGLKSNIKSSSIGKPLRRLLDKKLVKQMEIGDKKGKYKIFDNFFNEYVRLKDQLQTF